MEFKFALNSNFAPLLQSKLKREAALSEIEEQLTEKDAIKAENAATLAKVAENEAQARALREKIRELQAAHDVQVRPCAMSHF